ncbi:MAG: DUF1573 domain-containing protein [Vicinamibacteria bacterium]
MRRLLALAASGWLAACGGCAAQPAPPASDAPAAARAAAAPRLAIEPESFDFGLALKQRTLSKEFVIRNFGQGELRIEGISTSCGCTAALAASSRLAPGARTTLRVSLETRDDEGPLERTVLLRSNDPERPIATLRLRVRVGGGAS